MTKPMRVGELDSGGLTMVAEQGPQARRPISPRVMATGWSGLLSRFFTDALSLRRCSPATNSSLLLMWIMCTPMTGSWGTLPRGHDFLLN